MTALASGTKVQYRKVGRAVIINHACPPERPCNGYVEPVHRYWVLFETGRHRGQERLEWIRDTDAITGNAGQETRT